MDVGVMDVFGRTHRYRGADVKQGEYMKTNFALTLVVRSLIAFRNPWFCSIRNGSTILYPNGASGDRCAQS